MIKFKDRSPQQKRNIIIAISVVAVIVLSLLIGFIVYAVPVEGKETTEHWFQKMEYTDDYAVNLTKEPGKDFKILAIADTQLADLVEVFQKGDPLDEIKALVNKERPDLIVVMGDITWTAFTKNSVRQFVKCMDEIGIPWAPIIGNHEDEKEQGYFCHVDKNWVADRMMESKTCLFKKGPNNIGGVGNYVINIKEGDKIVETLIMMDSHAKRQYPEYGNKWYYDYIYDSQMLWYRWVMEGVTNLNGGVQPESMLYIHIPLPEYETAYNIYKDNEKQYNETKDEKFKAAMDDMKYIGEHNEGVYGSNTAGKDIPEHKDEHGVNSGFFDVLKEVGSTKYVYAGHDHKNNYSILYEGIRLTYTTKTGYRCSYEEGRTGGTYITIGENVRMKHAYAEYDKKGKLTGIKYGEEF